MFAETEQCVGAERISALTEDSSFDVLQNKGLFLQSKK